MTVIDYMETCTPGFYCSSKFYIFYNGGIYRNLVIKSKQKS